MLFATFIALGLPAADKQPNIVHIVADDLGWKDVGFNGCTDIKTPNLDKLAAEGAKFTQFYVQPMCTPTRAALMTGRYPFRYGLQTIVIPTAADYGLDTNEWLMPQCLAEAGYKTAIIGKWHLGHADKQYWPKQRGFDYQYGAMIGELDYFTHDEHGVLDWFRDNKPAREKGYTTALLGNDAVAVYDGREAQAAARTFRPDYVLLDIGLPGMNGYDVAVALRADETLGEPVIVAVSGYGQEEDRRRSFAAGFDHHLVKPVDLESLAELIGRPD